MKSEWKKRLLSDIMNFKNGKKRPNTVGTIPVYGGNGVLNFTSEFNNQNCIVIGRVGAYCGSVFRERSKCWVSDNAICCTTNSTTDIDYGYYLLKGLQLNKRHIGTSQPLLTQEILNRIEIFCPPLNDQQKIGKLLLSLDEKIELNQKINENLERQAQAIFEENFLSVSDVPNGWKKENLLEIADYLNGLAMQKYRPEDREVGIPVLKIKELRQGSCDDSSELCSPSIKSEYIVHDGDVVFSWSGSLLVDFWCGGTCGLNQHLFKVTSKDYDKWFYYSWTVHHLNRFIAIAADKATTMGHIKREELAKAEVLIPSKSDYDKIGAVMKPIYDLIIANRLESRKLAEARDSLIPKLMSGEIDVSNIQL